MDDTELNGGISKSEFTSDEILALARSLVEAVQKNEANLTTAGVERGVAERIAGFLRHRLSSPPNEPSASRWTVKRPTKTGWYWLKVSSGVQAVYVVGRIGGLSVVGVGPVSELFGAKWCGPIEGPE